MQVTNIGVVNHSRTPDQEVLGWIAASKRQMAEDVAPIWQIPPPEMALVPIDVSRPDIDSWIIVVDDAQQRIGLGYHEVYNNQPVGYVLVEYTKSYNQQPSRVFSHEVLEMAIDPTMTDTVTVNEIQYIVEAGDVLAFDASGYRKGDVLVSGFATPGYFFLETSSIFSFQKALPGPLPTKDPQGTVLGFYQNGVLEFALQAPTPQLEQFIQAHLASRRYRRSLSRDRWVNVAKV